MAETLSLAAGPAPKRPTISVAQARASGDGWTRKGLLVLLLTLGIATLWSVLAPLSSAVLASGTVKVDSSRKKIQHPDGGVIKDILVRDGQVVEAGAVLVRLDESRAGAAHGVVRTGRDMAVAGASRLAAERDDRPAIDFPPDLVARSAQPQIAEILSTQRNLFATRRAARNGELSILDRQVAGLQSEISGHQSRHAALQEQLGSLRSDLTALQDLDKSGMVEKTRVRGVERDIARLTGEREELTARMATARTAIHEKELKKFQIRKAFQEEVAAELRKTQSENLELLEREGATKRALELTELRAPAGGTVTDLKVHTAGGVIGPGEVLLEIVPSADRLVLEARVMPQDIDRVMVGQPVGIKLHAFNSRTTPELEGQLAYVSADAMVDARTEQQYFIVRVDVPAEQLSRLGDQKVQPGMQADVFIRTGERTFFGYLIQPLSDSFRKAWLER